MLKETLVSVGGAISQRVYISPNVRKPIKNFLQRKQIREEALASYKLKLINETELGRCYRRAIQYLIERVGNMYIGDYLEFGVCHGTSMKCMHDELHNAGLNNVRLFGFDSFEGLPPCDDGHWQEGSFKSDYDYTKKLLTEHGINWGRAALIKGWFNKTLNDKVIKKYEIRKASLIMVDCDIYSSTKDVLKFVGPLIKDESVMIFDDWNPLARENKGEKRAFDEYLVQHPEFKVEEFDEYSYSGNDLNGKVFTVSRQ